MSCTAQVWAQVLVDVVGSGISVKDVLWLTERTRRRIIFHSVNAVKRCVGAHPVKARAVPFFATYYINILNISLSTPLKKIV